VFHWEFRRLANRLTKEKRVSADGLNRALKKAFILSSGDKILFYLSDEKTPCVKGEAFVVEYVREGAEHILEVLTTDTRCPDPQRLLELSWPTHFGPPVKSKMFGSSECHCYDGTKLQKS